MKIMDCTLRDGANVVGNGFPADLTAMMLKGLVENGVSIIEYGNAKGLGAEEVGFPSPVTDQGIPRNGAAVYGQGRDRHVPQREAL